MAQIGTPTEVYQRPASAHVAAFVGSCNFLIGRVVTPSATSATVRLDSSGMIVTVATPTAVKAGDEVTIAIRPERLTITPKDATATGANVLDTVVLTRAYVGNRYEYGLKLGNIVVQVVSPNGGLDGEVRLVFNPEDALVYPGATIPSQEAQELMTVAS
jgi:iron(III) transport system ATP-binding protein